MALLGTGDGISCDVCGTTCRDKFLYYSINGNIFSYKKTNKTKIKSIEFDMCSECREKYHKITESHIDNTPQRGKLKDDFSDKWFDDTIYMSMVLIEVQVDKDAVGGVVSTQEDVDFNVAGDSLNSLLEQMAKVKEAIGSKGSWSTK